MSVIVYEDKKGDLYGFCSRACLDFWLHYFEAPLAILVLHQPPQVTPESGCGCWWCGTDLMNQEGIQWVLKDDTNG